MGVLLDVDSSFFSSVALNATGCASDVEGPSSSLIFFEPLIINSKLTKFPITSSGDISVYLGLPRINCTCVGLRKTSDLIITLTISWSSHFLLPRLRTWFTKVLSRFVHILWLLPLAKSEATELPLDRFPLGDLGYFVSFVRRLEYVPNLLGALQSLHLVILLST
jgi:hypothetical protein